MSEIVENDKYFNGKIYFLMNNINHEIFYIGSTTKILENRLYGHKLEAFCVCSRSYDS